MIKKISLLFLLLVSTPTTYSFTPTDPCYHFCNEAPITHSKFQGCWRDCAGLSQAPLMGAFLGASAGLFLSMLLPQRTTLRKYVFAMMTLTGSALYSYWAHWSFKQTY